MPHRNPAEIQQSEREKPLWVARYSSTHERMFRAHLLSSAQKSGLIDSFHCDFQELSANPGVFGSDEFNKFGFDSTRQIIEILRANPGRVLFCTGVDFHFYQNFSREIIDRAEQGYYVAISDDGGHQVCGDFLCVRSTLEIIRLFENVFLVLGQFSNQQVALNHVLALHRTPVYMLDHTYWTVGIQTRSVWKPSDVTVLVPPTGIKLHHANWTVGAENKLALLDKVEHIVKSMASSVAGALLAAAERSANQPIAPAAPALVAPVPPAWNEDRAAEVRAAVQRYLESPQDDAAERRLRETRLALARTWLQLPPDKLKEAYGGAMGACHRALLESGIVETAFTEEESQLLATVQQLLSPGLGRGGTLNHLLAGMLFEGPHMLTMSFELGAIPPWFMADFLAFRVRPPRLFRRIGEVERFCQYLRNWLGFLHGNILSQPGKPFWRNVAIQLAHKLNFIPLFFTDGNLKELYRLRAGIIEHALSALGHELDFRFGPRGGARRRLGILADFGPQTETFATLPVYSHLDRSRYQVILLATSSAGESLEKYCASYAERFMVLPAEQREAVRRIRELDLDALWVGTNLYAVTSDVVPLAAHRLARVQMTGVCSPATSGFRNVDVFVSGTLTEPQVGAQSHYTERLEMVRGIAHCFDMAGEPANAAVRYERAALGIGDSSRVFVSGANFYKIIPELQAAWLEVLVQVPDSVLVLYPFNPNWRSRYPVAAFLGRLNDAARQRGIAPSRIKVLMPLESRGHVKALLRLADVYLDSFPHSGMTSLLDPLEVGLPVVVRDGTAQRSRQGAAALRTIGMEELIAPDAESYVRLCVRLAGDAGWRRDCSARILRAMAARPAFLDPGWYGAEIERLLDKLLAEPEGTHAPESETAVGGRTSSAAGSREA